MYELCGVYVVHTGGDFCVGCVFFFQAEDGIRDLVRSRGLGDVYKRQAYYAPRPRCHWEQQAVWDPYRYANVYRNVKVCYLSLIHI